MKIQKTRFITALLYIVTCMLAGSGVQSAVVKHANLAELASSAQYIFSGQCVERKTYFDEALQRDVWAFTFKVEHMIKGDAQDTVTVKTSKLLVDLKQVPLYSTGEEVVLFLTGASKQGFSSPVGLGQGKFTVIWAPDGARKVVNEQNNVNLFKGMDRQAYINLFSSSAHQSRLADIMSHTSGPIDYTVFITFVEFLIS